MRRLSSTFIMALGAGAVLVLALAAAPHLSYTIWTDRDLLRAVNGQVTGAEMNGTYMARSPGGAYYLLLRLLMVFGDDPGRIKLAQSGLLDLCLVPVFVQVRALWGLTAALLAVSIPMAAPAVTGLAHQIWNPAISIALVALASALLLAVVRGRAWTLPLLVLVLMAAIQVHLSNLTLALGCLIAAALAGRGLRARHWLAALAMAVLAFLPYALADMAEGWTNTRLILAGQGQGMVSRPHADQLLRALIATLGSPESDVSAFPPGPAAETVRTLAKLELAAIVALVAFTLGRGFGLAPRSWRHRLGSMAEADRGILAMATAAMVIAALLLVNRNSTIYLRYTTPLTLPMAILAGAAISRMLAPLETRRAWAAPLLAATVMASLVWSGLQGFNAATRHQWPTAAQRSVLALVEAGMPPQAVASRVMVLGQPQIYMDYILARLPAATATGSGDCVAVLPEGGADEALRLWREQMGTAAEPAWSRASGNGWAIGSHPDGGNCRHNVDNPYHALAAEEELGRMCRSMPADGAASAPLDQGRRIAIRRTFPGYRLCLGLDLAPAGDNAVAVTVHSTQLRGYTGYPSDTMSLESPVLTLTAQAGKVLTRTALVEGRFGGQNNPIRPPWRMVLAAPIWAVAGVRFAGSYVAFAGTERHDIDQFIDLAHD